jgi:hypothetical protein
MLRANGKPRSSFVGAFDGAPDDQLMPEGHPEGDRDHALAVVLAPSWDRMQSFISEMRTASGYDELLNQKWSTGGNSRHTRRRQRAFIEAFCTVFPTRNDIHINYAIFKESDIRATWASDRNIILQNHIQPTPDGRRWKIPVYRLPDGGLTLRGEVPDGTMAVYLHILRLLDAIYNATVRSCGHKPLWTLHSDRMPNDPTNALLGFGQAYLSKLSSHRVLVQWTNPERQGGPDLFADYLADHVCTWILKTIKNPSGKEGQALSDLLAGPCGDRFRVPPASPGISGHA